MQSSKFACFSLIASALILAGLLLMSLQSRLPSAQAEMVLTKNALTMLTAPTADGEESLFIIDSTSNRLLIYQTNMGQKRLELVQSVDLGGINVNGAPARRGR